MIRAASKEALDAALKIREFRAVAGERMLAVFRGRCLRALRQGGFDAGVFGHVHRAHAVAGDPYVNSGALHDDRLEYAVLDGAGIRIERLHP